MNYQSRVSYLKEPGHHTGSFVFTGVWLAFVDKFAYFVFLTHINFCYGATKKG
jgi:hypothetical protein